MYLFFLRKTRVETGGWFEILTQALDEKIS